MKCCRSNKGSLCEVGKERGRRIAEKKMKQIRNDPGLHEDVKGILIF